MKQLILFGKTKEEEAIEFIRENEPEEGYFLGFSGGKDSVVLYNLAVKSGVKFEAYYSAVGIDPPELVKFIREYYPEVKWKRPNWRGHTSFYGMIPEKGFPTKMARWCCDKLKKDPTKKVPLKHRLMGLRAEESASRAKRGKVSKLGSWTIYKPIFNWLTWEIWEYIADNNIPYCCLYDEGFDRLGCVVCPFLCQPNTALIEIHKARWPKQYKAFEKAMYKLWNRREKYRQWKNEYSFTFDEFLNNWYHGSGLYNK